MFEISNKENDISFYWEVVGYQFPDIPTDDWCLVKIKVKQGGHIFEKIDPAIEAKEIKGLHDWFEFLANDALPSYVILDFIEPCISFSYLACGIGKVRVSVNLSHELEPDFGLVQFQTEFDKWNIIFNLDSSELQQILKALENTMEKYPVRSRG